MTAEIIKRGCKSIPWLSEQYQEKKVSQMGQNVIGPLSEPESTCLHLNLYCQLLLLQFRFMENMLFGDKS